MTTTTTFPLAAMIVLLALAPPASGQTDVTDPDLQTHGETIVVTAQKREQPLHDVDIHITVLSADEIAELRLEEVTDLASQVANVDIKTSLGGSNPIVTIRGVGLNDFAVNNNPTAGIYVDDVFLTSTAMMGLQLFDMERVEVLKGPQGTLYGRNTTAGALNLITRKPDERQEGRVLFGAGSQESFELEGALGGALGERTFGRLSLRADYRGESFYRDRQGKDFGDSQTWAGRAQLAWTPRDDLSANLKLHFARVDGTGPFWAHYGTLAPDGSPCPALAAGRIDNQGCFDSLGFNDGDGDPYTGDVSQVPAIDSEQLGAALTFSWTSDDLTLTSITAFESLDRRLEEEADGSPFTSIDIVYDDAIDQFSQELRLQGTNDRLDWLAGLFYSRDEVTTDSPLATDDLLLTRFQTDVDQTGSSLAAFAHTEWRWTDRLTAVLGARFTSEDKDYVGGTLDTNPFGVSLVLADFSDPFNPVFFPFPFQLSFTDRSIDHTEVSGKLGVRYQPSARTTLYANFSRGFKSGGIFGGITFSDLELEPFEPETLHAWEAGFKQRLAEDSVQLDGSVFYYDYSDLQTLTGVMTPALVVLKLGNVEDAEIWGADLDLSWEPDSSWQVRAGLGLLSTELGAFEVDTGPVPAGNELPNAPGVSLRGLLRHSRPLGQSQLLSAQIDFNFQDDMFKEAINIPYLKSESRWLWNGRLAWTLASGLELALWGKNLGDETYVLEAVDNGVSIGGRLFNEPRTYGFSVSFHTG